MAIQCEIIPAPQSKGVELKSEASVLFADTRLREELQKKYPDLWTRINVRRKFIIEEIGIDLKEELFSLWFNAAI